jgi:hypothetical protein
LVSYERPDGHNALASSLVRASDNALDHQMRMNSLAKSAITTGLPGADLLSYSSSAQIL